MSDIKATAPGRVVKFTTENGGTLTYYNMTDEEIAEFRKSFAAAKEDDAPAFYTIPCGRIPDRIIRG